MNCEKCGGNFPEKDIQESHDVPCYLFEGVFRNERKNQADKLKRHWLCVACHKDYENGLKESFQIMAIQFSNKFFSDYNE